MTTTRHLPMIAVLSTAAIALAGCASADASSDGGGAAAGDVTTIRLGYSVSDGHPMARDGILPFVEAVEENSGGSIQFDLFPDSQLADGAEVVEAMSTGIMDASFVITSYLPHDLPLNTAWGLPYGLTGPEQAATMWQVLHQENALSEELRENELVPLMVFTAPAYEFSSTDTPLDSIESLAGLRYRSPSNAANATIEAVGGSPIQLASPETYEALDRGTVDGVMFYYAAWGDLSLGEQLHHSTSGLNVNSAGLNMVAITQSQWDSLSDEQRAIMAEAGREASMRVQAAVEDSGTELRDELVEAGTLTLHEWPEEEVARFQELMAPVPDAWASGAENAGFPGTEVVELIRSTAESVVAAGAGELPEFDPNFY